MNMQSTVLIIILLISNSACSRKAAEVVDEKPRVMSTVGMLTDIVERIAGDVLYVNGLIGEGVDPHLFTPSASDVRLIQSADLIFYVGHNLEGRLQRTLERRKQQGHPVFAVAEKVDTALLLQDEDGQIDPHLWMDVTIWAEVARIVAAELGEWLPQHAGLFDANLKVLLREMKELEVEVRTLLSAIPPDRRILITAHDAFGYLGRRYEIEVLGIQGFSTDSEAGLRRINELVERIVSRQIPSVFVESTVADKQVLALVEGAMSQGHSLRIGGKLFSDAMGAPGTEGGTYFGMIRHNARTIAEALSGETL